MLVSSVPLSETQLLGPTAPRNQYVQLASDPCTGQRGVRDQRQALAREVVDDRQDAEAPPVGEAVGYKVQRPALIGTARQCDRRSHAQCPLAAATLAYLQLLLAVQPPEALLVHATALSGQQQMQATVAEATPLGGELPNAEPHRGVACTTGRIAHR